MNLQKYQLKSNDQLLNLKIDHGIGSGTFGEVFKVHEIKNPSKTYALKCLILSDNGVENRNNLKSCELEALFHKDLTKNESEKGSQLFANLLKVFYRNCRIRNNETRRMEDHKQFFFLMEFLNGDNLMDRYVERQEIPSARNLLSMCQQFIDALSHLKNLGYVHADLKPENICFASKTSHNLKIIDFGNSTPDDTANYNNKSNELQIRKISKSLEFSRNPDFRKNNYDLSSVTCPKKGRTVCTAEYRPPEVVLELDWSFPVDTYSLGVIIYELLFGKGLMPEGLDDDSDYENLYDQNRGLRLDLDDCEAETHHYHGIRIAQYRRHLNLLQNIAEKNTFDEFAFGRFIYKPETIKNKSWIYKHSRPRKNKITKIIKWCMTTDDASGKVLVDKEWVNKEALLNDEKHAAEVDFNGYRRELERLKRISMKEKVDRRKIKDAYVLNELTMMSMKMLVLDPSQRITVEDLKEYITKLDKDLAAEIYLPKTQDTVLQNNRKRGSQDHGSSSESNDYNDSSPNKIARMKDISIHISNKKDSSRIIENIDSKENVAPKIEINQEETQKNKSDRKSRNNLQAPSGLIKHALQAVKNQKPARIAPTRDFEYDDIKPRDVKIVSDQNHLTIKKTFSTTTIQFELPSKFDPKKLSNLDKKNINLASEFLKTVQSIFKDNGLECSLKKMVEKTELHDKKSKKQTVDVFITVPKFVSSKMITVQRTVDVIGSPKTELQMALAESIFEGIGRILDAPCSIVTYK